MKPALSVSISILCLCAATASCRERMTPEPPPEPEADPAASDPAASDPAAPAAADPTAETGFELDTVPSGAAVFVEGRRLEQVTPVRVTDLEPPAGAVPVHVRVLLDGYKPAETLFLPVAGEVVELEPIELEHGGPSERAGLSCPRDPEARLRDGDDVARLAEDPGASKQNDVARLAEDPGSRKKRGGKTQNGDKTQQGDKTQGGDATQPNPLSIAGLPGKHSRRVGEPARYKPRLRSAKSALQPLAWSLARNECLFAPAIDAATGELDWACWAAGTCPIEIRVEDARGSRGSGTLTLECLLPRTGKRTSGNATECAGLVDRSAIDACPPGAEIEPPAGAPLMARGPGLFWTCLTSDGLTCGPLFSSSGPVDTYPGPSHQSHVARCVDGRQDGFAAHWIGHGLAARGSYRDDLRHGLFTWYWQSHPSCELQYGTWRVDRMRGQKKVEGYYEDGEPHGVWTSYFPGGAVESRGSFELGRPVGEWTWWDPQGKVLNERTYTGKETRIYRDHYAPPLEAGYSDGTSFCYTRSMYRPRVPAGEREKRKRGDPRPEPPLARADIDSLSARLRPALSQCNAPAKTYFAARVRVKGSGEIADALVTSSGRRTPGAIASCIRSAILDARVHELSVPEYTFEMTITP